MSKRAFRSGFTLVELLLFVGIIAVMTGVIVSFSFVSTSVGTRNQMVTEVNQNGEYVLAAVARTIEDADIVAWPRQGTSANALLLVKLSPLKETVLQLYNGRIRIIENGVNVSYLSTGDVGLRDLGFFHAGTEEFPVVSFQFQAYNQAVGVDIETDAYARQFHATATAHFRVCHGDGSCNGGELCCGDHVCRPACGGCLTPGGAQCVAGELCCITDLILGTSSCMTPSACAGATPQCRTIADCPSPAPSCVLATCTASVPRCDQTTHMCGVQSVGPCADCSRCGDGSIDGTRGEECDDGNIVNNDPCTTVCTRAVCGDHIVQANGADGLVDGGDDEQCDDGDTASGDGCSSTCQHENLCAAGGPNGILDSSEQCDDGNGSNADACDVRCRKTRCGDSTVQSPDGYGVAEQCDDGNTVPSDGCSSACQTEADGCGDGNIDPGEACDDGKRCTKNGDLCQSDVDCMGNGVCRGFGGDGCTSPMAFIVPPYSIT